MNDDRGEIATLGTLTDPDKLTDREQFLLDALDSAEEMNLERSVIFGGGLHSFGVTSHRAHDAGVVLIGAFAGTRPLNKCRLVELWVPWDSVLCVRVSNGGAS